MKEFKIPLIDIEISIYVGEKEWKRFRKDTDAKDLLDEPCPGEGSGRAYGTYIWIYNKDLKIVMHEMEHALQAIMEYFGYEKECEFRANVAEYIYPLVLKWGGFLKETPKKKKKSS